MKPLRYIVIAALAMGLAAQTSEADQAQAARNAAAAKVQADMVKASAAYQQGLNSISSADWAQASEQLAKAEAQLAQLQKLSTAGTVKNLDAAMYWQAYAASKLGKEQAALAKLEALQQEFPDSSWMNDAKALTMQMKQLSGQTVMPAAQGNDDLKLLAINSLMENDPAQALPMLEKVVHGTSSPAVKSRALFVMAQNHSPEAIADITAVAESNDPALSAQAVKYLGMEGGSKGMAALAGIYAKNANKSTRTSILHAYMLGGDKTDLLAAAKSETDPDLQQMAVHELGISGGKDELWQLYQANPPTPVKASILHAMFLAGDTAHLIPLAKAEKEPSLRADAIHSLGLVGGPEAADALTAMYTGAQERSNSQAIIQALFVHGSAADLVSLARKETDPELKRSLVQRLSMMHDKAATAYLLEILNQ